MASATNRVAINTVIQYTRLVLNLVIALVSVRIILNALGANDYGVYDVVGGVIALIGFLNSSLSQTSIRYLSVSLGENSLSSLRKTFSNCFWLHLLIAAVMVVILEIVGVFLFDGFLNIPTERIIAAYAVYHCMTITTFLQIAVTPFQALIISHEKFIYTACVSIIDSLLKLLIAYILVYAAGDKLILYGVLMALVTVLNTILFILYVIFFYRQEMYIGKPSLNGIKGQSGFAGWTILDILGCLLNRQGYAIMLNKFFGTSVNATFAVARQIEGQVYGVSAAVIDTMKPQIMKSFGSDDTQRMLRLSMTAGKFGFTLMSFVCIPLLVYTSEILTLWLKNVPDGAVVFVRLLIGACMIEQITRGLVYASQATGQIKWFTIVVSLVRLCALPISILLCYWGAPAYFSLVVFFVCETLGSFSRLLVMSKIQKLRITLFFSEVVLRSALPFSISIALCYYLRSFSSGLLHMITIISFSLLLFSILSYLIGLTKAERVAVKGVFKSFMSKKNE